jgi:predicted small secreted protein
VPFGIGCVIWFAAVGLYRLIRANDICRIENNIFGKYMNCTGSYNNYDNCIYSIHSQYVSMLGKGCVLENICEL